AFSMSLAVSAAVGETHTKRSECSTSILCQPSTGSVDAARIENCACAWVTVANRITTRHAVQMAIRCMDVYLQQNDTAEQLCRKIPAMHFQRLPSRVMQ